MFKKVFLIFLLVVTLVVFTAASIVFIGIYVPKSNTGDDVVFIIKRGDSMNKIAVKLEQEGIIKSSYFFNAYGKITEQGRKLKPGSYVVSTTLSIPQIMEMFVGGGNDRFVIIEGWNLRDIAIALEESGYVTEGDFYNIVGAPSLYIDNKVVEQKSGDNNFKEEFDLLKEIPENLPLEGFLFPDTYFISPGTSIEDIIRIILLNFDQRISDEIREDIEKSDMGLFEVITKASLIEKEVVSYEDKRLVAGIIENRIKRGMRLQIDATITYLTQKRSVQIPIVETRIKSPYNTYVNHGLPIGPICSPGLESIMAALNPKESDYLYYLSKPTGETVFSKTHDEHVRAKNKYLR